MNFSTFKKIETVVILAKSEYNSHCVGIRDVCIRFYLENGYYNVILTNILYMFKFIYNLISTTHFDKKGIEYKFKNRHCYLLDDDCCFTLEDSKFEQ